MRSYVSKICSHLSSFSPSMGGMGIDGLSFPRTRPAVVVSCDTTVSRGLGRSTAIYSTRLFCRPDSLSREACSIILAGSAFSARLCEYESPSARSVSSPESRSPSARSVSFSEGRSLSVRSVSSAEGRSPSARSVSSAEGRSSFKTGPAALPAPSIK